MSDRTPRCLRQASLQRKYLRGFGKRFWQSEVCPRSRPTKTVNCWVLIMTSWLSRSFFGRIPTLGQGRESSDLTLIRSYLLFSYWHLFFSPPNASQSFASVDLLNCVFALLSFVHLKRLSKIQTRISPMSVAKRARGRDVRWEL